MMNIDLTNVSLKLKTEDNQVYVFESIRKKWLVLTPEEHVRQCIIHFLITKYQYPASLIAVEKQIQCGPVTKRFDIVVYNRHHKPWLLIECKAPDVPVDNKTLQQLLNYQRSLQCSYWMVSNGHSNYCADARDVNNIKWLEDLPPYNS